MRGSPQPEAGPRGPPSPPRPARTHCLPAAAILGRAPSQSPPPFGRRRFLTAQDPPPGPSRRLSTVPRPGSAPVEKRGTGPEGTGAVGFFFKAFLASGESADRGAAGPRRPEAPFAEGWGGGHRSPGGVACGRVKKEEFNFPQFYQILLKKRFCRTKRYCKDEILRQTVKFAVISGFIPIRQLFPFIY